MVWGRRFIFGIVAIICVSVVSIILKYNGEIYLILVWGIVGIYTISQSATDIKELDHKNGGK